VVLKRQTKYKITSIISIFIEDKVTYIFWIVNKFLKFFRLLLLVEIVNMVKMHNIKLEVRFEGWDKMR